jgi:hypothetical protein
MEFAFRGIDRATNGAVPEMANMEKGVHEDSFVCSLSFMVAFGVLGV